MHVALNGWFWDQPYTGSGQYLRGLMGALRRARPDLNLSLVTPGDRPADLPDGVNAISTRANRSNLGKVMFEQRAFPNAAARAGADLAHVPYWGPPLTSPIPLVTTILDVIPLVLPEYAAGFLPRLYTSLVSASARGAGEIVTISEAAKADIVAQLNIPAERITVTHLAVDERYHPRMGAENDPAIRAKYDLPPDYVLYLGGFDRRKNVQLVLKGFSYLDQAEGGAYPLVIAGREPVYAEPLFPNVRALADSLGVSESVHWIGAVDEADKPGLLRMARAFVFPSVYEGFGLPVLEAMAAGTPVIAADIPVMREIVGDAAYLVGENEDRAMGGAMLALVGQEPLRQQMINRALGRATAFNWRKTALETIAVYERVLSSSSSG